MSDFLYSTAPLPAGALRATLAAYLDPVSVGYDEFHGPWGSLAVARSGHDAAVVQEDGEHLSVLVGEPIVRIAPERPGFARGGARRSALHRLLASGRFLAWDAHLDGPFAALAVDKEARTATVVTDLMAFVPVFSAPLATGPGLVVGTHVDAVARAAGVQQGLDLVSAADLVAHSSIVYPYTLYTAVEQVAPAVVRRIDAGAGRATDRAYWTPVQLPPPGTLRETAALLRDELRENVRIACGGLDRVGMLFSAGEDSRAVIGLLPAGVAARAFVFSESENREIAIARRAAHAYGAELVFGRRGPTHHLEHFERMAGVVGSQHRYLDAHAFGLHETLGIREMPRVLGGFSADAFLKAHYAPTRARHRRPLQARVQEHGPLPVPRIEALRRDLLDEAVARRERRREALRRIRPDSADEWLHLWPFSNRRAAAALHGHRRLFHSHEPFVANVVVKLSASAPLAWKLNRRLFLHALRPALAPAWHVPHTRSRYPYFGAYSNLLLGAGLRAARGVRGLLDGTAGTHQGPWPEVEQLARTGAMAALRRRYGAAFSSLQGLLAPGDLPMPGLAQLLLLQLAYHAAGAGPGIPIER